MRLLILAGFLGSGKTTLLQALAETFTPSERAKLVIIENEAGDRGVDDRLLASDGLDVRQFYGADSVSIPALLVLELISKSRRPLSELVDELRSEYFISGEINSEVADPEMKMKEIAAAHAGAEISWLDGVSVDYPDWHFNVRPSNTEPLLRLNLESLVSRADMEAKRDEVLASIRS